MAHKRNLPAFWPMSTKDQLLGRWVLALCLAVTAASKLAGSAMSPTISAWWTWLAFAVEILAAGLLISRAWRAGAILAGLFGVVALSAIAIMRMQGMSPGQCGCFGLWKLSDRTHVLVALGFVVVSSGLMWQSGARTSRECGSPSRSTRQPGG